MIAAALALALAANPRPLPFSYTAYTQAAGQFEIEQYVDMIPAKLADYTSLRFQLQTELELGVTDSLELGFYLVMSQDPGGEGFKFEGLKQRVRWRLFEPGELPVDLALYGEIAEYFDEAELEEKLILSRRFGSLLVAANLVFEQEYEFEEGEVEVLFNPTLGASLELTQAFSLGLEGWMRINFEDEPINAFVGPVLLAQLGDYWATVGGYVRLDGLGDAMQIGDRYGPFYLRVILGIGL